MKVKLIWDDGWYFTINDTDNYRTNSKAQGLWVIKSNGEHKQIEGTCQFDLPYEHKKAYQKLYNYFFK